MYLVSVDFLNDYNFKVNCDKSGKSLFIDSVKEDKSGLGPSPVELFLSSLAGCIGVFAKAYLTRHSISFTKLNIKAKAAVSADSPRRLVNIEVLVDTDADIKDKKDVFLRFIEGCPIHNTVCNGGHINISLI